MGEVLLISPEETYSLRLEMLWPHFDKKEDCGLSIDKDDGTFHVGAFDKGRIVSIATFLKEKNDVFGDEHQYRLRAMASLPLARGKGFGKRVIDLGKKEMVMKGATLLWCDARKSALDFYNKIGFTMIGDFYNVPKIGLHKLMYYRIK